VVADSYGASDLRKFRTVILPSMVPFILAGARLGIGRGVIGVVIGEFYSSQAGLGNYIFVAGATLQIDEVLFGALFITGLALIAFTALQRLERRFQAWRPDTQVALT
jgi:NitT/TauT family transport system permease protein